MTTSINTILKNRKNRKNKKGFSLVELIVVLVIMAILAAALVPTLIGYIKQTRQSNAKNEAAAVVSAAQTIASSAYADGKGKYYDQSNSGNSIDVIATGGTASSVSGSASSSALTAIAKLAEINKTTDGAVYEVTFSDGLVTGVIYKSGGTVVLYSATANSPATYRIGADSDLSGLNAVNGKAASEG